MVITVLGVGIAVYPSAAAWFSELAHDTVVDGYVTAVENIGRDDADGLLAAARSYNANLPGGPLRDPYALDAEGRQTAVGDGVDAYRDALAVDGTDAIGRVRIPSIDVDLPIYHGTSESTLARGIGHLYGSGLPVGGDGSHAALAGHNGYVGATFFDEIGALTAGDTIIVSVAGHDLYYEVDQQSVVEPGDTELLRPVPGHDYLTLITCTPTGINTHRLLVRAERVDAPIEAGGDHVIADRAAGVGFPWWAVPLVGAPVVALFVVAPRPKRRAARRSSTREAASSRADRR